MTMGTLRDQVIYPHNRQEQLKKGFTDKDLEQIVSKVSMLQLSINMSHTVSPTHLMGISKFN